MLTLYLDTNTLNCIVHKKDATHELLGKILKDNEGFFYTPFSSAHILDMLRDETDMKYEDARLYERYVSNRYLEFQGMPVDVTSFLATPSQALNQKNPIPEIIRILMKIDDLISGSLLAVNEEDDITISIGKKLGASLMSMLSLPIPIKKPKDLSKEEFEIYSAMAPELSEGGVFRLIDILKMVPNWIQSWFNDDSIYRKLRLMLLNKYKLNIEDLSLSDPDFDSKLKNTSLRKSFLELVDHWASLIKIDSFASTLPIEMSRFFISYFAINILGIDREKNRKVKFANTLHDAIHAYFGGYCEILVSSDSGFLDKAGKLYKISQLETQVISTKDFVHKAHDFIYEPEKSATQFFNKIQYDLNYSLVSNTRKSLKYNRDTYIIKPKERYFNYLNYMQYVNDKDQGEAVFISHRTATGIYLNEIGIIEIIENLLNNMVSIFGPDKNGKSKLKDFEIKNLKSLNRTWHISGYTISFLLNPGSEVLELEVAFPR